MSYFGHLRELKEVSSLPDCLTQLSVQAQVNIRLLELDGTILFDAPQLEIGSFCGCVNTHFQELISQVGESIKSQEYHDTICNCGKDLLLLPIRAAEAVDGIVVIYPYITSQQQLFVGIAKMISSYLALARNAVHKTKRAFNILDVHEEFFRRTELFTELDGFYSRTLETLLTYINAEAGIFIPRMVDMSQWDKPVFCTKNDMNLSWLTQIATWAIAKHEIAHCPMIVTIDNGIEDLDFQQIGVSTFISSTMYYEGEVLGIIIFCSQNINTPAFDDLELLESLKGTISLRLHNLHHHIFKERFLQNAFHSLKAPAHSIIGLTEIIGANSEILSSDLQESFKSINQQAQRLVRLTKMAPMLARLHKSSSVQSKISLKEVVAEATATFQITALKTKNVRILQETIADECIIMGNKDDLCEVLENLLDNSLKVTEKNKAIYVKLEIRSSAYQVSVIDEGPGVPKEQRELIFNEFVSIPRFGMTESSGLGLTIARNIIESHGGTLIYVDPTSNYGACFQFTVPKFETDGLGGEEQDARTYK